MRSLLAFLRIVCHSLLVTILIMKVLIVLLEEERGSTNSFASLVCWTRQQRQHGRR
jgi:hypothetical protein